MSLCESLKLTFLPIFFVTVTFHCKEGGIFRFMDDRVGDSLSLSHCSSALDAYASSTSSFLLQFSITLRTMTMSIAPAYILIKDWNDLYIINVLGPYISPLE